MWNKVWDEITYPFPYFNSWASAVEVWEWVSNLIAYFILGAITYSCYKNTERHTADTIVSWPNPKQWVIVHTSDLMMIIRQSIYILSIITREMGKLKTHSPMCCIMDNWENMPHLTHSTNYIWQAFYKFNVFRKACTMMIMIKLSHATICSKAMWTLTDHIVIVFAYSIITNWL